MNVACKNGAKSLKINAGEIAVGKLADFTVINCLNDSVDNRPYKLQAGNEFFSAALFGAASTDAVWGTVVGASAPRQTSKKKNINPPTVACTEDGNVPSGIRTDGNGRIQEKNSTPASSSSSTNVPGANATLPPESVKLFKEIKSKPSVLELAKALINVNSVSGHEKLMADALKLWFESHNYHCVLQEVEPENQREVPRYNVFAKAGAHVKNEDIRLVFNTHIDVVPPWFGASVIHDEKMKQEILKGRGSNDTKSLIASMLLAGLDNKLAKHRDEIAFLFVVSEETTHQGMIKANELKGLDPEFMIVGEPTEKKVIRFQKGVLKLKIHSHGVSCHSGYPHLGESAISKLIKIVHELQETVKFPSDSLIGNTDMNIGFINGGQAFNALAEKAEASLMFRIVTDPDSVLKTVQTVVNKFKGTSVELVTKNGTVDMRYVDKVLDKNNWEYDTAAFNTDIAYFKFTGCAFLYGHGNICDAHCSREHIKMKDLVTCPLKYCEMAAELLSKPKGSCRRGTAAAKAYGIP